MESEIIRDRTRIRKKQSTLQKFKITKIKIFTTLLFFVICFTVKAQEINYNGIIYKIKGKAILQNEMDVTSTLSPEEQTGIWDVFNKQIALDKEREAAEKAMKKAEKAMDKAEKEQKKAEKKQKKAEKELKAKEKAQSKFEDANDDYTDAMAKYEKLKRRGKLSPNDEAKWLDKIQDFKDDIEKAKKKL